MGQKVHPEIFKLSKTAGWKSKYIEGKKKNLGLHARKDLEIRTFIKQFFTEIGLNIHKCKISYLNRQLNIQLSYTKSDKMTLTLDQKLRLFYDCKKRSRNNPPEITKKGAKIEKIFFIVFLYNVNYFKLQIRESHNPLIFTVNPVQTPEFPESTQSLSKKLFTESIKIFQKKKEIAATQDTRNPQVNFKTVNIKSSLKWILLLTKKALTVFNKTAENMLINKDKSLCKYKFITLFCKSFVLFFKQSIKIALIFKAFNNSIKRFRPKLIKNRIKKKVLILRKYKRNKFFKKGLNLMLLITSQKEAANIISSYASSTLRNFKKHKLFLKFLKKSLYLFAKNKSTVIEAVKIQLKGRINGADRARHYVIKVGNQLSLLTTSSRVNYSESTTFTPDGTLSVKVWVTYKKPWSQFKSKRHSHKG